MSNLDQLNNEARALINGAADQASIEAARVAIMGKSGSLTNLLKQLGTMAPDERKEMGQKVNALRDELNALLAEKQAVLNKAALAEKLAKETIDISLPIRPETSGSLHPTMQILDEMVAIFAEMGFTVATGPEIEDDFHNFTALNFPPDHPARTMHDTFYLEAKDDLGQPKLLRTQTSTVQIRSMMEQQPPLRLIVPGRTFRAESDMTHTPMFHQMEGLVIDKTTHMGHLKGCLMEFWREIFGIENLPVRFRPSFFPFTELSAEVDIGYSREGSRIVLGGIKGQPLKWMEIGGCGMVHPNVIRNCGLDPEIYQGFAFGMGVERIAMLKYGMPDLRDFFNGDLRWLRHYGFSVLDYPNRPLDIVAQKD
ncbi:MAG TPA: phenylalanine--tRNA ligase subunit alpha [Alphaproteobacteria bacterium]